MRGIRLFGKKILQKVVPAGEKPTGLIVPLITPMNQDKSVDEVALKVLTARLMNKGVRNFLVLGTYSEQEFLSAEQKEIVLKVVWEEVFGKGLMIAACFGDSVDEIISNVNVAQKYTDLCLVNIPTNSLERELDFIDFFDSLFTQTTANILIYNNPSIYKKAIPPLWLDNIINWERLVGVIDYSRNPDYLDELGKYHQLSRLFEANEEMAFDAMRRNFSGLSCISAIAFPSYYISMIENFDEIDYPKMIRLETKISTVIKMLPADKKIQAFKYALSLQHLIQFNYSNQLQDLTEREKLLVEKAFGIREVARV